MTAGSVAISGNNSVESSVSAGGGAGAAQAIKTSSR